MLEVTQADAEKLASDLETFARKAVPFAVRNALNTSAFEGRKEWIKVAGERMILRNTWTTRQMKVTRATGLQVRAMEASLGSPLDYMGLQEQGGTLTKRGKHGHGIPTSVASGEGRNPGPRQKLVRRPNRMGSITLASRVGGSRKQRNAAAIRQAVASGRKYVFLDLERRKGIFRISGGKRRPKLDMIWDLTRPAVRVKKNPTLEPAIQALTPRLPAIHVDAVRDQMRRHRVLGY